MLRTAICLHLLLAASQAADLRFKPAPAGEFDFNTGVLSGKLRAGGKSIGLLPVVHVPTGAVLTRSMGLAGHYRVFSGTGRSQSPPSPLTPVRYGNGAWDWPSDATLRRDGSVEVHWPAAEDRPFEMWAVYAFSAPATLEVETRVRARAELPAFESLLASYFAESFTESLVCARGDDGAATFLPAEESHGVWQIFPRDPDARSLIRDGRWKLEPHPVDWAVRPALAHPLAFRRDPKSGTTAILMAPPDDCFAVATPHQTEPHFSLYFSLFGRTLKPGELARARVRLLIAASPTAGDILDLYRAYLRASTMAQPYRY